MRWPVVAGRFYPSDRDELIFSIESCFSHELGPGLPKDIGNSRRITGAVVPHAGYAASGMVAAHVYKAIAEDGLPDAYILIGPDHYGKARGAVMCSEEYSTPLGPCKIHRGIADRLRKSIPDDAGAHSMEHSIEVQVPFIQSIDTHPHIVPVLMGDQDPESARDLASVLEKACEGYDVIFIASSDMMHYVPRDVCRELNGLVLSRILEGDTDGMYREIRRNNISVCGYGPIATAVSAAHPGRIELLKYSDSWDSLKYDQDSVVGYASVVMYR